MKKQPDPIDVATGNRIRISRMARGMSQSALADGIGVSFQQVQKYEKGSNRVGASRLTRIASILEVSVSSLVEDSSQPKLDPGALSSLTLPGALELLNAYQRIESRDLRRTLVKLAQQIVTDRTGI